MLQSSYSDFFTDLATRMKVEEWDELIFLIDDYLEHFNLPENISGVQLFSGLLDHLGAYGMCAVLDEAFQATGRNDLCLRLRTLNFSELESSDEICLREENRRGSNAESGEVLQLFGEDAPSSLCEDADVLPLKAPIPEMGSLNESQLFSDLSDYQVSTPLNSSNVSRGSSAAVGALDASAENFANGFVEVPSDSFHSSIPNDSLASDGTAPSGAELDSSVFGGGHKTPALDSGISTGLPSSESSANLSREESLTLSEVIEMTADEMRALTDLQQKIGTGGFGNVYKGNYKGKHMAIKEQLNLGTERQFLKEKWLSYLRNTYILPVLAYTNNDGPLMIMYPYMESGDLRTACQHLTMWQDRARVFYQCSEGLAFLHQPVIGVRKEIIHGDIKPGNILLDVALNARLGDAGLAVEIPSDATHCTITSNISCGTEGYKDPFEPPRTDDKTVRRKENDVFSLGVVGLQLLKWQPAVFKKYVKFGKATITEQTFLYKKLFDSFPEDDSNVQHLIGNKDFLDMMIWNKSQIDEKLLEEIVRQIFFCFNEHDTRISAEDLANNFMNLLRKAQVPLRVPLAPNNGFDECLYCCFNQPDPLPTPVLSSDTCSENCTAKKFCQTCLKTAYRNPLYCPEHGLLKRPEEAYAILVSGYEAKVTTQKKFDQDVEAVFNTITDPRISGLKKKKVPTATLR